MNKQKEPVLIEHLILPENRDRYILWEEDLGKAGVFQGEVLVVKPEHLGRRLYKADGFWRLEAEEAFRERRIGEIRTARESQAKARVSSGFNSGWIQAKVAELLEKDPGLRDNDEFLCVYVWDCQLLQLPDPDPDPRSAWSRFRHLYMGGYLANAEAIVRARRIVQKERPDLRGITYDQRQQHAGKVREAVIRGEDPNEAEGQV